MERPVEGLNFSDIEFSFSEKHGMGRYIKDTALTFITQLLSGIFAFLIGVIIARTLGPSGKGVVSLLVYFSLILSLLLSFGLNTANAYFIGRNNSRTKAIISNTLFFSCIVGTVCVIFLLVMRGFILRQFLKNVPPNYLVIALISTPFLLLTRNLITIPQGLSKFKEFNLLSLTTSVSKLLFIVFFLLILKSGTAGGIWAYTFSSISAAIVCILIIGRTEKPGLSIDFPLLKTTLRYGGKTYIGVISELLNYRLDLLIVNYFLNPQSVGFYAVALGMAELVRYLPRAVARTLFPRVASSKNLKKEQFTIMVFRNALFLSIIGGACLCVFANYFILWIYGPSFIPAVPLLQIIIFGIVASGTSNLLVVYFCGKGKPEYFTYVSLISLGSVVSLDLILIPTVGVIGAAIALTLSYLIAGVICVYWFHKESNRTLREILILTRGDIALCKRGLAYWSQNE